jgi:hypothetical protein
MLDRCIPSSRCKGKLRLPVTTFGHWRQLKEIASNDKLYASEWAAIISDSSGDFFKLVEQVTIDHRHFIDDEHLGPKPTIPCFLISLNL